MSDDQNFARGLTGRPYSLDSGQVEGAAQVGAQPISEAEARVAQKARGDIDYVDQNWSAGEKALGGVFDGGTLGLGPAALVGLGLADGWQAEALRGDGAYMAGEVGGMIAPAFLTGGESLVGKGVVAKALAGTPAGALNVVGGLAERLAGRLLPEAGVLGGLGRQSLQMAARGATEGSLINMSHTVSDSVIQDKPLTWASMAASGAQGALMGGLVGGGLGSIAAIGGKATDAVVGKVGEVGSSRGAVAALKRVGATAEDLAALEAKGEIHTTAAALDSILKEGGESLASKTSTIAKVVKETELNNAKISNDVVQTLDREAPSMVPNINRVEAHIQTEIEAKYAGTIQKNRVAEAFDGLKGDLAELGKYRPREPFAGREPEMPLPFTRPPEPAEPGLFTREMPVEPVGPGKEPRFTLKKPEPDSGTVSFGGGAKKGGGVQAAKGQASFYEEMGQYRKAEAEFKQAHAEWAEKQAEFLKAQKAHEADLTSWKDEKKAHGASERKRYTDEHKAIRDSEYAHNRAESQRYAREVKELAKAKAAHEALPKMIRENTAGGTWEGWTKTSRQLGELEAASRGVTKELYRTAKMAVDAEIRSAMDVASDSIGRAGLSKQYSAALFGETMAREFGSMIGNRTSSELGSLNSSLHLNSGDVGAMAYSGIYGHPIGGMGIVAGKKLVGYLQRKLEPVMAEAAYRASLGSKAQAATINVGENISRSLKTFMVGGTRAAASEFSGEKVKYSRPAFEKSLALAESLMDSSHRMKVQKLARDIEAMGHEDLAKEAIEHYDRAVTYLQNLKPQSAKIRQAGSLQRQAKPSPFLNTAEYRFLRVTAAVSNPVGTIIGGLERGDLGREQVKAIKYVYPALHKDLTARAAQEILAIRMSGKFISEDKVAMMGLVLDAPVDSRLEKGFIDSVQKAHVANNSPPKKDGQPGNSPISDVSSFQTPLQNSLG